MTDATIAPETLAFLKSRSWKGCPFCGSGRYQVHPRAIETPVVAGQNGQTTLRTVLTSCLQCGHVAHFLASAVESG